MAVTATAPDTQRWHRVLDENNEIDTTLRFEPNRVGVLQIVFRVRIGGQKTTFTCNFPDPMPAPPWPPTVGATFTGHAECSGFTTDVSGKIESSRTVTLDGSNVGVFVVHATIVTHGQVESTMDEVDWFAPAVGVPTHTEIHQNGTAAGFPFGADVTSDLKSARPS